jgi:hypothetical protein
METGGMSGKKKQLDFTVRPRAAKEELPPDADSWVRGAESGSQKRLTLNLPAGLHTAFKGRCVLEGITIQDKVRVLIERELAAQGEGRPLAAAQPFVTTEKPAGS